MGRLIGLGRRVGCVGVGVGAVGAGVGTLQLLQRLGRLVLRICTRRLRRLCGG